MTGKYKQNHIVSVLDGRSIAISTKQRLLRELQKILRSRRFNNDESLDIALAAVGREYLCL